MNSRNYHTPEAADIEYLKSVTSPERVISGSEISEDYHHDELGGVRRAPDVLVKVQSTEEVSAILRYAQKHHIAVTPRGQGTGLVGASVALYGGIMLDLSLMNHFLEFDEKNMTLTLEPGVLLMDIAKYVEPHGLFYPPDPGEKTASIGGNVNTNAGGMRAVKYGVTRDYVRGMTVVLADGRILELGGKVVKNSSGYDLKDLLIGSEGTLGVITKLILKLIPLPKFKISLLVPFPDVATAIAAVPEVIRTSSVPTAAEFMEREVILASEKFLNRKFPDNSADAYLLLTFDGMCQQEIDIVYEAVAHRCIEELGALDVFIADTEERNESIWSARGAFLEAIKASTTEMDECDVVIPRKFFAEFVQFSHSLQDKFGIRIRSFGHAGDGNLHIYVLRDELDETAWQKMLSAVFGELYGKAQELGGKVSGEHGIGFAKKGYLNEALSTDEMALMAGIKQLFDPAGILNPGKVITSCQS